MNKKIRRYLRRAKQRIGERLGQFRKPPVAGEPVFSADNIKYDVSERVQAINAGGIGLVHKMVRRLGLPKLIDEHVHLLEAYVPYHESDHVLNIAYNVMCGGKVLSDIELRRNDVAFLDALGGVNAIPDPTTAGDFCRRFTINDVHLLTAVFNRVRQKVWAVQPASFFETARVDIDGVFIETLGECKEGMDLNYKGKWGYHALVCSLANTQEPLYLVNRPGNRPSHEGAAKVLDKAIELCRRSGFRRIILRGDTDFSLTSNFDRWNRSATFVFGVDASDAMKDHADLFPESLYEELMRRVPAPATAPRTRTENIKERIVKDRGFENIRLMSEDVGEFEHQPAKCSQSYRVVFVRKNLKVSVGHNELFDDYRYFFYITNDWGMSTEEVVREANSRCNQENLGAQLKGGVYALRAPLKTLVSNWAYMMMASLAWSLKAWLALSLPETGKDAPANVAAKRDLLAMEFRTFLGAIMLAPTQILHKGRRLIYRLLSWNPWRPVFFRLVEVMNC